MHKHGLIYRERNASILFGLFGAVIGLLTPIAVEQATTAKGLLLALAPLFLPVILLLAIRPVFGAAALIGFGFINPSLLPPFMELGPLTLRYVDGVFALLIGVLLARSAIQRRAVISSEVRELFTPLAFFLLYVGLSLVLVRISAPTFIGASAASYMRLLLTASFVPVLCLILRDEWDIQLFNKALIFFSIATVAGGAALVGAGGAEALAGRSGGVIGIGSLGLVSGLLVLYAPIKKDANRRWMAWLFPLAVGLLGLYLAKTASAAFAIAVTTTIYFASMRSRRVDLIRWTVIGAAMMVVALVAIFSLRESDVSGAANLSGGSFAERLMIGYAGLQIFLDNPVTGVGWQASTAEEVLGSRALMAAVDERFPLMDSQYFSTALPSTLHNMYIQFLAELGIIGFALFVWVCFRTGKSVARMVKNIPAESPYKVAAQFYALALIFLLIWWNNNPLFGGQIETMLAFTFLAVLAKMAELERQRVKPSPVKP